MVNSAHTLSYQILITACEIYYLHVVYSWTFCVSNTVRWSREKTNPILVEFPCCGHLHCLLDQTWNHVVDTPLEMSARVGIPRVIRGGKTHPECGCQHPIVWGSGLHRTRKWGKGENPSVPHSLLPSLMKQTSGVQVSCPFCHGCGHAFLLAMNCAFLPGQPNNFLRCFVRCFVQVTRFNTFPCKPRHRLI